MACSDVAHDGAQGSRAAANRYKFLLAVDLRRFGTGEYAESDDWTGGTVACAGGAIDYAVKVPAGSGARLVGRDGEAAATAAREEFWRLAKRCKAATRDMVEKETLRCVRPAECMCRCVFFRGRCPLAETALGDVLHRGFCCFDARSIRMLCMFAIVSEVS